MSSPRVLRLNAQDDKKYRELEALQKKASALVHEAVLMNQHNEDAIPYLKSSAELLAAVSEMATKFAKTLLDSESVKIQKQLIHDALLEAKTKFEKAVALLREQSEKKLNVFQTSTDLLAKFDELITECNAVKIGMNPAFNEKFEKMYNGLLSARDAISIETINKFNSSQKKLTEENLPYATKIINAYVQLFNKTIAPIDSSLVIGTQPTPTSSNSRSTSTGSSSSSSSTQTQTVTQPAQPAKPTVTTPPPVPPKKSPAVAPRAATPATAPTTPVTPATPSSSSSSSTMFTNRPTTPAPQATAPAPTPSKPKKGGKGGCSIM